MDLQGKAKGGRMFLFHGIDFFSCAARALSVKFTTSTQGSPGWYDPHLSPGVRIRIRIRVRA